MSMRITHIRVASDLHLEAFFGQDPLQLLAKFLPPDERDSTSVLVLAGDISSKPDQLLEFLRYAAQRFQHTLFVPGNHEYYKHDYNDWNSRMEVALPQIPKLSFCTSYATEVRLSRANDIRFVLATLWGDGGRDFTENVLVQHGLLDFRVIRKGQKNFTVMDMIEIHKRQKAELENFLKEEFSGITVVCTHHMPSYRLCHPRFGTDINGGFASNCDNILAYDHAPAIWIHGHTHDTGDRELWKTRIVCNPAGYKGEWSTTFNTFASAPKFIEL